MQNSVNSHRPQMYDPLPSPFSLSILSATAKFSVPWSPRMRLGQPWTETMLRKRSSTVFARLLLLARMPVMKRENPSIKQCITIFQRMRPRSIESDGTRQKLYLTYHAAHHDGPRS